MLNAACHVALSSQRVVRCVQVVRVGALTVPGRAKKIVRLVRARREQTGNVYGIYVSFDIFGAMFYRKSHTEGG